MGYAPQAIIDHAALRHNLRLARQAANGRKVWAVIKADGYGHGMLRVAHCLGDADGFAVARLDEALQLRQAGIDRPILILAGCYTDQALNKAAEAGLQIVLHHRRQLTLLQEAGVLPRPLTIWLKVDTGMHRLGFDSDEMPGIAQSLRNNPAVGGLNLMSHLATADDRADSATQRQCDLFNSLDRSLFDVCSLANSAGLLGVPDSLADWVRPGIMLYGASPFLDTTAEEEGLRAVMTLRSRVIAVKHCRAGERIGYGGTYVCPETMPVAVIAIGYGDGYPRHAPSGTPVLVKERRLPLAGRVSMDMISVDARGLPQVQVGDEAVLWGKGLAVDEIAERAGTIAYELLCGVSQRVEFIDLFSEGEGDGPGR
ncbi:MAG: alanine racemase [Candidatus Thiodiazotropha sp. (ex Dulcina madagascariensis)]|nr:alanine racemase [Candidatus Thiodiazotropha sp. (ex Dulcina madagascariensis)]MCU7926390.1 alanine racemase [Candidatus Thiodiazotropha sp. (ex Dulcina madagascariensis)]